MKKKFKLCLSPRFFGDDVTLMCTFRGPNFTVKYKSRLWYIKSLKGMYRKVLN